MKLSGRMLALTAFMNLALYGIVRIWVIPRLVWGQPYFTSFYLFSLAFQFNWILLMVGALHEFFHSSVTKVSKDAKD